MIKCAELNKEFSTQEDLFKALLANEKNIIDLKKASISKSCDKGQLSTFNLFKVTDETKSLLGLKEGHIYPVINTTGYRDSHKDVHFPGIWNKSAKEQDGSIFYVLDHSLKVSDVIAWPSDVKILIKTVPWSFVGKDFEGDTEALIYEIKTDSIENQNAKDIISKKRPVQNSVRMQYVKIRMAINSTEKEYTTHKAYFDEKINSIANKDEVMQDGYFFGVEEAKISKEGSMVLFGSNDATPINYTEAGKSTSETEPPAGTQTEKQKKFVNLNLL